MPGAVVLSPMRLDPRAWLACERTLLSWLHLSTILAAVATGVINFGELSARPVAICLMIPALVFVLYATRTYYRRVDQLSKRQLSAHDDRTGPLLLVVGMSAAVLTNLGFRLTAAHADDSFDPSRYV